MVVLKQLRRDRQRRGFAPVQRGQPARCGVIPDQKRPAAQARALRFNQPQHRLDGDQRIGSGAAPCQHIRPRLNRMRVGGGDHPVPGDDGFARILSLEGGGDPRRHAGKAALAGTFGRDTIGGLLRESGPAYKTTYGDGCAGPPDVLYDVMCKHGPLPVPVLGVNLLVFSASAN